MNIILSGEGKELCAVSERLWGKYQSKAQNFLPSFVNNCSATNVEEEREVLQQQNRKDFSKVEFQESHNIVIKKFASSVLSNKKMKFHRN